MPQGGQGAAGIPEGDVLGPDGLQLPDQRLTWATVFPSEQIALNLSKVEIEYKEQKPDGALGGAIQTFYDMKVQKGG